MIQPVASDRTAAWHETRNKGVGASEIAAVCGLSKWQTPLDVWAIKTGRHTVESTPIMELGTALEPYIFDAVAKDYEVVQRAPGVFQSASHPQMLASPDAILSGGRGLECKVTTERNDEIGEGDDEIPASWLMQATQQMVVCDFESVVFAVVIVPSSVREWLLKSAPVPVVASVLGGSILQGKLQVHYWEIKRSETIAKGIASKIKSFWRYVETDTPPPVDFNHPKTVEAIKNAFRYARDSEFAEGNEELQNLFEEKQQIAEQLRRLEKRKNEIDGKLLLATGDKAGLILPNVTLNRIVIEEAQIPATTRRGYSYLRAAKRGK